MGLIGKREDDLEEKILAQDYDLEIYEPDWLFDNQILTVKEAAKFLKVSEKTIYKKIRDREIPFKRVGRVIRFHLPELIGWFKGG